MVKKLLLAITVLLVAPHWISAQPISTVYPMSPRLDSLQAAVYAQLNIKAGGSRKITDVVTTKAINRGVMATCATYPALEKIDTVILNRYDSTGTLPADFHRLARVWRIRGDTLLIPVKIVDPDSVEFYKKEQGEFRHKKASNTSPDLCWTHGRDLRFFPRFVGRLSTSVDTLQIEYLALDAPLSSDADTTVIDPYYINKVIDYACMVVSATRENFDDAAWYFRQFQGLPALPREVELKK